MFKSSILFFIFVCTLNFKFKATFSSLQRVFSWNCLKSEKKCCFCKKRSDFNLNQISEFLADFAHIQVWSRWNSKLSKNWKILGIWPFWSRNGNNNRKSGHRLFGAIFRLCCDYALQNGRKPIFFRFVEKTHVHFHHATIWSKSEKNSKISLILKSEHSEGKWIFFWSRTENKFPMCLMDEN